MNQFLTTYPVATKRIFQPPLEELAEVLFNGLTENFDQVSVDVVDCPDLTKDPFTLVCPGLSGNPQIFDIGGVPYLVPLVTRDRIYNIPDVCKLAEIEPVYAIGAGAGPWPFLGVNCEGIINLGVKNGQVNQQSRIASVSPIGAAKGEAACKLQILPKEETRCALLANVFISEGKRDKVLRIICENRTGNLDYISSIRMTLEKHYKDKAVGLGGTFLLEKGKAKQHIMPDFSKTPLNSNQDVEDWLNFFEMTAPLINVGTLVSKDPGLDLRIQHFHTFSHHGEGGHYHIDTTPADAKYVGYFNTAQTITRVDAPIVTHEIGRD